LNKLKKLRVQKTIEYLETDRGNKNWSLNVSRGYSYDMNLFAAVQTATRLIIYEKISEVLEEVRQRLFNASIKKAA